MKLKVVTLNVAEFLPSNEADATTWTQQRSLNHFAHHIVHDADVVCVQEWPKSPSIGLDKKVWMVSDFVPSHCGLCAVMLRRSTFKDMDTVGSEGKHSVPCATVLATTHCGLVLLVSSVHNTPFGTEEASRLRNLTIIVDNIIKPFGLPSIIAGDFNMRAAEDPSATMLLRLKDSFEEAGSPKEKKFTFNTKINRYHENSRRYNARYDRIYFSNVKGGCTRMSIIPGSFDLVAHTKITDGESGNKFFLSDHFGLTQSFALETITKHNTTKTNSDHKLLKHREKSPLSSSLSPSSSPLNTPTTKPTSSFVIKDQSKKSKRPSSPIGPSSITTTKKDKKMDVITIIDSDEEDD
eukprot:m.38180 g.38180  ORF g.38180 m.38180 type:complete len:351 (+) comp10188_c0_seq1:22-1074(+)